MSVREPWFLSLEELAARGMNYEAVETAELVGDGRPDFRSLSRRRAERWAERMNARRNLPSYRYEVIRGGRRWAVVAMQNVLRPIGQEPSS